MTKEYIPAAERYNKPPPPDVQHKLELSEQETEGLTERIITCPYCEFYIDTVFSDLVGHYRRTCRKCKRSFIINAAYFRRIHRKEQNQYKHRYSHRYYMYYRY